MVSVTAQAIEVEPELDVEAVYREHAGLVWTNLRRFGVPVELLEDAVHDVFVVVHRRAAQFAPERASITTWIFGIVRRTAADYRRSRDRRLRRLDAYRQHTGACEERRDGLPPAAELRVLLADLLGSVDAVAAQIFVQSQLHGIPLATIAADLGLNRNTAASRLRATRRRFAQLTGSQSLHPEHADRAVAALAELERADPETMEEDSRHRVLAGLVPVWSMPAPALPIAKVLSWLVVLLGVAVLGGLARDHVQTHAVVAAVAPQRPAAGPAFASASPGLESAPPVSTQDITVNPPARRHWPEPKTRRRARPSAHKPVPTLTSALREELALVFRARAAVRDGDLSLALRLARKHQRRFREGALSVEMAVVGIDTLCRLGRETEAAARARALPPSAVDADRRASPCR